MKKSLPLQHQNSFCQIFLAFDVEPQYYIMKPFLNLIIDKLLDDCDIPMYEVAVILPNRRAKRHLLQGLSMRNGQQPMFAPRIMPMEDFIGWLSPLQVIDPVSQMWNLYRTCRQFQGERFELHSILSWGSAFLKDISDMDMQLQDVPVILREYADAAKFEVPFGKESLSEGDIEKMRFNDQLADIYGLFVKQLREKGAAYEGMMYRDCAENIADYARKIPFKRVVFAGFYALSPAELTVMHYLQEHFHTEFYFDIDPFYCHLEETSGGARVQREPSFFIKRNCEKLQLDPAKLEFNESNYATISKEVKIMTTAQNMRQIYCAIEEIERIKNNKIEAKEVDDEGKVNMSDTAVVLADEELLLPFLSAYNPDDLNINATMGFPFSAMPHYSMLQQLMAVYESVFVLTADDSVELSFSGEQLEQLWNHELLRTESSTSLYFPTIIRYSQLPHKELFGNCSKSTIGRHFPSLLLRFCQYAETITEDLKYKQLWRETIRRLSEVQEIFDSWFAQEEPVDFPFAKFAVTKMTNDITIDIKGDPDTGLQVMGLLETRMMDFKNVVMLSVNEGILPHGLTYDSLLPFDFKYKFDGKEALPNYLYQDQVYAYHFFRLLQRAENILLLYNSSSDTTMAEKSRFISQLEYEVKSQQLNDIIHLQHEKVDFDLSLPVRANLSIPKSDQLLEKLHQHAFSASSLQTFILCPLKLCLRYLMKVQPTTILSDRLEANELGTVIHAIFNAAFDEIIKCGDHQDYYEAILQKYIDQCDELVCAEILQLKGRESMSRNELKQGYWLINRRIIKETVVSYLERAKTELLDSPWRITSNEMKIDIQDYTVAPGNGKPSFLVKMTGSIDRVQKNGNGEVMILDYKTGKVEESKLHLSVKKDTELTDEIVQELINKVFTDSKYDKLFQLATYLLMYDHVVKESASVVKAGILSTREVSKNSLVYLFKASILKDENLMTYKPVLQECMNGLFLDIFDAGTPFEQTETEENCKNCDFLHLCGRQTVTERR